MVPATTLGVLWDLDGVLADSGAAHFQAWSETLAREGVAFSDAMFRRTFGMNNHGVLTTVLGHQPEAEWLARVSEEKEAAFRAAVRGRARALPGVRRWLAELRRHGVRQAVASSAPPANIQALVNELELRPFFEALVSAENLPSKPDPAVFIEAAHRLGVPPSRCVVVEDAVAGVEAARRGGMRCIAVTTTNSREALATADAVVDSLDELTLADWHLPPASSAPAGHSG